MILLDANLLIYAYNRGAVQHEEARQWWESTVQSGRPIGLTWVVILAFVRMSTRRAFFDPPLAVQEAKDIVQEWLTLPNIEIIAPGPNHQEILFELLTEIGTAGDLTTDAHLAALAIEYQAEIASTDTDFARFRKIRWINPLAPAKR